MFHDPTLVNKNKKKTVKQQIYVNPSFLSQWYQIYMPSYHKTTKITTALKLLNILTRKKTN